MRLSCKVRVVTSSGHGTDFQSLYVLARHRDWQSHTNWPLQHTVMCPLVVDVQSVVETRWNENPCVLLLHRDVLALHLPHREWTLAPPSKLGTEINDMIKEELFHQEATVKENDIESLHGKSGPLPQELNLKIDLFSNLNTSKSNH